MRKGIAELFASGNILGDDSPSLCIVLCLLSRGTRGKEGFYFYFFLSFSFPFFSIKKFEFQQISQKKTNIQNEADFQGWYKGLAKEKQ
jgi:hypothetical protein